jgi:protein involved in polysaccharide export with SLBB domain
MTILDVISRAGGFSLSSDKQNVVVIRKQQGVSTVLTLNLKRALQGDETQNIALVRDDIVYVPTDTNKVYVMGEINTQGPVQFESPFKMLELISKAGGVTVNANKTDILLIRSEGGESSVSHLNIEKALIDGDFNQNQTLQNGDIVYVQKLEKRVIVLGEVKTPGYYNYTSPLTVLDAISKAGGLTNNANEDKLVVIKKGAMKIISFKGIVKKGAIEDNIALQNGDIVYVPTTFIADVENVLGHITTIFSSFSSIASPVILLPQVKSVIKGDQTNTTIILPTTQ